MTKPINIRVFDYKNKSKVISSVYWSHLKGNKAPYLSVNIKQLKYKGKVLNAWGSEGRKLYKKALKEIAPDIYDLYCSHLVNMDNYNNLHEYSNGWYFIEQTRRYLWDKPITVEQKREELKNLKQGIIDDFNQVVKVWNIKGYCETLNKFKECLQNLQKQDYYNYPRYSKETMIGWFCRIGSGLFVTQKNKKITESLFNDIFTNIESIRKLEQDLRYPTIRGWISKTDIWTVERLAEYLDLDLLTTKMLVIECENKEDFEKFLQPKVKDRKKRLQELTEKYSIPIIHS